MCIFWLVLWWVRLCTVCPCLFRRVLQGAAAGVVLFSFSFLGGLSFGRLVPPNPCDPVTGPSPSVTGPSPAVLGTLSSCALFSRMHMLWEVHGAWWGCGSRGCQLGGLVGSFFEPASMFHFLLCGGTLPPLIKPRWCHRNPPSPLFVPHHTHALSISCELEYDVLLETQLHPGVAGCMRCTLLFSSVGCLATCG